MERTVNVKNKQPLNRPDSYRRVCGNHLVFC